MSTLLMALPAADASGASKRYDAIHSSAPPRPSQQLVYRPRLPRSRATLVSRTIRLLSAASGIYLRTSCLAAVADRTVDIRCRTTDSTQRPACSVDPPANVRCALSPIRKHPQLLPRYQDSKTASLLRVSQSGIRQESIV